MQTVSQIFKDEWARPVNRPRMEVRGLSMANKANLLTSGIAQEVTIGSGLPNLVGEWYFDGGTVGSASPALAEDTSGVYPRMDAVVRGTSVYTATGVRNGTGIVPGGVESPYIRNNELPLKMNLSVFTFTGWIYPTEALTNKTIFFARQVAADKRIEFRLVGLTPQIYTYDGATLVSTSGSALSLNTLYYVVVSMDATGAVAIYVGSAGSAAVLDISDTGHFTMAALLNNQLCYVRFGNNFPLTDQFLGTIDEFRFFNAAISTGAIETSRTTGPSTAVVLTSVVDVRTSRIRDYQLQRALAGELNLTLHRGNKRVVPQNLFAVDDKIQVLAGYGGEVIPIFTGYVDRVAFRSGRHTFDLKLRDELKKFTWQDITTDEYTDITLKDVLDNICTLVGVAAATRVFDDPGVVLNYWAPIDQKALEEIQKVVDASGDGDLYVDEAGLLNYRNYLPSVALNSVWETDFDFTNRKTTLTKFTIASDRLNAGYVDANVSTQSTESATADFTGYGGGTASDQHVNVSQIMTATRAGAFKSISWNLYYQLYNGSINSADYTLVVKLNGTTLKTIGPTSFSPSLDTGFYHFTTNVAVDTAGVPIYYNKNDQFEITLTLNHGITGGSLPAGVDTVIDSRTAVATAYADFTRDSQFTDWVAVVDGGGGATVTGSLVNAAYSYFQVNKLENTQNLFESSNLVANPVDWGTFVPVTKLYRPTGAVTAPNGRALVETSYNPTYYLKGSSDSYTATHAVTSGQDISAVLSNTADKGLRWAVDYTPGDQDFQFYLDTTTINWTAGGVRDRFTGSSVVTIQDAQIAGDAEQVLADELGGIGTLINYAEVKSQPVYVAGAAVDVWQGTVNGNPISASNPLQISAALVLEADLGQNVSKATEAVAETHSGVLAVTLTKHSSKPTITLTPTGMVSITDLRITGKPIVQAGDVLAVTQDAGSIAAHGTRKESVDNSYINQLPIADAIADTIVRYYKDPRDLIIAALKFTPHLQLGDRVTVDSARLALTADYIVMEISHTWSISADGAVSARTQLQLWELR